jgi:hypothetical protein
VPRTTNRCCESGSGSGQIRIILSDPDLDADCHLVRADPNPADPDRYQYHTYLILKSKLINEKKPEVENLVSDSL